MYDKDYFSTTSLKNIAVFERYTKFIDQCGINLKNAQILDIGCGTGTFLSHVESYCKDTFGTDISTFAISKAKLSLRTSEDRLAVSNLELELPPFNQKFDSIFMFDVIEHFYNFTYVRQLILEHLKPDGYLCVTTPNANSLMRFINNLNYSGEHDVTHRMLFTPYTLDFFLRRIGLERVVLATPYSFFFYLNTFTKYIPFGGQIFAIYRKKNE